MSTTKRRPRKTCRKGPSAEDRAAQAEALQQALVDQIEDLTNQESWLRFLEFSASFYSYSLNNLLLILSQNPEATYVAGFRQWQAKDRQVRAGEKAIKIRGYSTKKITEEDPETGDEVEHRQPRFSILSVFDIAQTDAVEGTEDLTRPRGPLTGEDPANIWDAIAGQLRAQGWTVERTKIEGTTNGFTSVEDRRVVVDVAVEPAMAAKTLIHEAAHATLHAELTGAEYIEHRGIYEAEAESVAYVVAGIAGLDTSDYSVSCIAEWVAGDLDTIRGTADNVLRAVRAIAPAITGEEDKATD